MAPGEGFDPDGAWAFYDHPKNRSGRWCSMAVCGNRAGPRATWAIEGLGYAWTPENTAA